MSSAHQVTARVAMTLKRGDVPKGISGQPSLMNQGNDEINLNEDDKRMNYRFVRNKGPSLGTNLEWEHNLAHKVYLGNITEKALPYLSSALEFLIKSHAMSH